MRLADRPGTLELFKLVERPDLPTPGSTLSILHWYHSLSTLLRYTTTTQYTCRSKFLPNDESFPFPAVTRRKFLITFYLGLKSINSRDYLLVYYQRRVICGSTGAGRVIITIVCSQDLQVVNQEKTTNYHPLADRERQVSHEKHKQNRNYKEILRGGGRGGDDPTFHLKTTDKWRLRHPVKGNTLSDESWHQELSSPQIGSTPADGLVWIHNGCYFAS